MADIAQKLYRGPDDSIIQTAHFRSKEYYTGLQAAQMWLTSNEVKQTILMF
jgi:hypothetical protein